MQRFNVSLEKIHQENTYRQYNFIDNRFKKFFQIEKQQLIDFCSNNYLALALHKPLIRYFQKSIKKYGLGSGASSSVSGYFKIQHDFEQYFAEYMHQPQALLFNSGYHANLGVLQSIFTKQDIIYSDRLCHASLIDGIRLSQARHVRFPHNHISHLKTLIEAKPPAGIVTETVFSMDGDMAPLHNLLHSLKPLLIIDNAHGVGLKSLCASRLLNFEDHNIITINPLGKAFSSLGAVVTGNEVMIDFLKQKARTFRYTTALPPALCATLIKTLQVIEAQNWRQQKLQENIDTFNKTAKHYDLTLLNYLDTPIRVVMIEHNQRSQEIYQNIRNKGFLITEVRHPTVPKNTSRLRVTINCSQSKKDIIRLIYWINYFVKKATH